MLPNRLLPAVILLTLTLFPLGSTQLLTIPKPTIPVKSLTHVKSMTAAQRLPYEINAVASGCPVKFSSHWDANHVFYTLDQAINFPSVWCPKSQTSPAEWIQASKQIPSIWTAIIIQGHPFADSWVKTLLVSYTLDGKNWIKVDGGKIYGANWDRNSKTRITFDSPVYARALRIYPQTWHLYQCLRFEAIYLDMPLE